MPGRKPKPPRLWLRTEANGERVWVILDRGRQIRTGCLEADVEGAARKLEAYLAGKRESTVGKRVPAEVAIGDILKFYTGAKDPGIELTASMSREAKKKLDRYDELLSSIETLSEFWGSKMLTDLKGQACRDYVTWRTAQGLKKAKRGDALLKRISTSTARRELENLRAAVNLYHAEYTLDAVPKVTMPEKAAARERWLTRGEAARLLGACLGFVWDSSTGTWAKSHDGLIQRRDRATRSRRRHIARFLLIGVYTGTRHEAILELQWHANTTGGWVDLKRELLFRRSAGARESKKRRPPARIPKRLRPHLARWLRIDREWVPSQDSDRKVITHIVHFHDGYELTTKIRTGWDGICADAGLGPEVVPHIMRHTAATWYMQAGTDLWDAAGALGMTVETLQNVYGHHHPDFQEDSVGAFSGEKRNGKSLRNDIATK